MSIDSGGLAISEDLLSKKQDESKKIDDELEDGELDTDDDEPVQQSTLKESNKSLSNTTNTTATTTTKSSQNTSIKSASKQQDDKSTSKFSSHNKQQSTRKRRRRSGSVDSDELSSDGKRRKVNNSRNSSSNNKSTNRSKRSNNSNASTDDSDNEDVPKIDQKMMFTMLKKMQEFIMNNNDKSNKHNKQEYDKFFERFKNNKSGHKEMMKFFKKNEKMMNQSSQDNLPAMFNSAFNNPALFPPNNMFPGIQPGLTPQQQFQQMSMMMGPGNNFPPNGPGSFNGPPQFSGPGPFNQPIMPNPMQQQYAAINDIARNSPGLGPSSSNGSGPPNKKGKKRKKNKEEKDDLDESIPPKQLCKYFLEGHCQKGNDCDFIHQQPYNYKREVCKFYLQDSCGKGDNCTFLHKEFPCKLFHTGQDCTLGDNCKFSHEPISEELREIFVNYLDNAELNEELNIAYGLSKNNSKKQPILGDVPEDVKNSYQTWVWQQEMKKLEVAYTGTKRNLFCIDDVFVLKEKPPRDEYDDDEAEYANFNDIDERQSNFYFDTHGNLDEDSNDEQNQFNPFTKDNDLRKEFMMNENSTPNIQPELKSLDEVKKQWLNDESEEEDEFEKCENKEKEKEEEEENKPSIDISKMLDAIRQTTTSSTQANQQNTTTNNSSTDNSEFWKTILNGVNLNESNNSKSDQDERSYSSNSPITPLKSITSQPPSNQSRDPRLLKQRNNSQQSNKLSQSTSIQKILADEPFTWSQGDINFKLYKIDVEKINYSPYMAIYETDSKMKNDPRLQNYFSNQNKNASSISSSASNLINPNDLFAPLTLSQKNEPSGNLIIPPAPNSKLSALDLISTSKQTPPTSQLSFEEQILASVPLPKKEQLPLPETGGLTSLADLIKSKKVNFDTTNDF